MTRALALLLVGVLACGAPARSDHGSAAHAAAARAPLPVVVAGTSGNYAPLSTWTEERPRGYAPALLEAFASGWYETHWTRFRWPELASDLTAKKFDVAADGITVRPERSIAGRYTVPIALGGAVVLTRRPAVDARELDREGVVIGVNAGAHLEKVARATFRTARIVPFAENGAVREALARGELDGAMTNTFEAPVWAAGLRGVTVTEPISADVTALWVRADREDLAERLDAFLLDEEASGRLEALRTTWLGPGRGPRAATPLVALLAATAERLALMPYVAAAKEQSGRAVEDRAQEERVLAASSAAVAKEAALRHTAPPSTEAVRAFFRAQIEAAKIVQARAEAPGTTYALDTQLRPAIARVTARMARLVARIPRGVRREDVLAAGRGLLDPGLLEPLATTIVALRE